jgi:hypothetical protein
MNIGNELQQHYPDLYPQVEDIFNKHDPMDFKPGVVTPKNEYDLEIWEILPHLNTKKEESELYKILLNTFEDKFGEETIQNREKQQLKKIAKEISEFLR